jgi:hypothetical protein
MQSEQLARVEHDIDMPPRSRRAPKKQQVECLSNTHNRDRHGGRQRTRARSGKRFYRHNTLLVSYKPRRKRFLLLLARGVSLVFTCRFRSCSTDVSTLVHAFALFKPPTSVTVHQPLPRRSLTLPAIFQPPHQPPQHRSTRTLSSTVACCFSYRRRKICIPFNNNEIISDPSS